LFRSGRERLGIYRKLGEDVVSRSTQARGHSAAVGLRSTLVNPLPAHGGGCLASVAEANLQRCVAGVGPVRGAIDPERILVFVFFGLQRPGAALVEIVVLLTAIAMTAMRFADFSRLAFWLMTPYGVWVLYASCLNFGIWRLNKGAA
jgi:hypothetical protein